ncbi:uncharacterized protein [Nicotiana sylvestris]|uniref:uncharacterized protein n=1 Tax=Nicotiana sylvestris TaxID=4096 RepID=UPI00388CBEA1
MPTGRLAKWQILLTEFDIVHIARTTMKAQALADHLAKNPVDDEYKPLSTYFLDEEVNSIEALSEDTHAWKMFFDGAVNAKGIGIREILISPTSQHYPATARLQFFCTNNTTEYEACIMGMNMAIDKDVEELLIMGDLDMIIRQDQGEWETRDVKLIPYRQHVEDLGKRFKSIEFRERHGYCNAVEAEPNVQPWYHDIKRFLKTKDYPEQASGDKKRTIRRHASGFFLSGDVLYKKTPDLNLLRCVDAEEAFKITHRNSTPYRPKANGAVEEANKNIKKILRNMIQSSRQWHEKLPFALLGYCTTVHTSVGATPYLFVYGTEAVIPAEVEIPSLWIIVEAEIGDSEWVKARLEQCTLIDEKRMAAEAKGKFSPNWKGPYIIRKILPRGALYLGDIEGNDPKAAVNADAVKRCSPKESCVKARNSFAVTINPEGKFSSKILSCILLK